MEKKSIRLKKASVILSVFIFCFVWNSSATVHAQSVKEAEPNDTVETAQLIYANRESVEEAANGSRPNEYVVNGYTSLEDTDWFKIYLTAGEQYVTCNGNAFDFEVYDPNSNRIMNKSYFKSGYGMKAYPFIASSSDYYYIKVTGAELSSQSYILSVGEPSLLVKTCQVQLNSVTMANKKNVELTFDLSENPILPDNAVIYKISFSGVRTTSVNAITVNNIGSSNSVKLNRFTWDKGNLAALKMHLKSIWEIKFDYYKDTAFTPVAKLHFVYPVVSECIDINENLVIIP